MLLDAHRPLLVAVDLRENMLPAVAGHDELLRNREWMVRVARKIGVPVAAIEPSNGSGQADTALFRSIRGEFLK